MLTTFQTERLSANLVDGVEPALDPEPAPLLRRWAERAAQRRALRSVNDLPPYLLDDIGLVQATRR